MFCLIESHFVTENKKKSILWKTTEVCYKNHYFSYLTIIIIISNFSKRFCFVLIMVIIMVILQ